MTDRIPLSANKKDESYEIMKKKFEDDEIRTRWCLGCGMRKTIDRFARTKCDRCLRS